LEAVDLLVNNNGKNASHAFFLANIGQDDFILGYPFFEASNPNVDWSGGQIEGFTTISSINANTWRPPNKGTKRQESTPAWVRSIPGWEKGDEIWLQTRVAKTTVAQQLAEAATDKQKCTWQEIVPERYHRHCYVLGLTQGAFFIFHLLTKLFPSRDQPPIHLDYMTNHLTSHLTTHMTSHMPFQSPAPQKSPCPISPAPKSPAHHLILPHLTSHDPILYHLLPSHLHIT